MPENALEHEVLEFAEKWAEAIISNDAEAIGSFMSEDWTIVGANGTTVKRDFLEWIASGDLTHETMRMIGDPLLQIYGETALLTARVTNNGHYQGQAFSADEWTTDVFLRRDGQWSCVLSHITPAKDE